MRAVNARGAERHLAGLTRALQGVSFGSMRRRSVSWGKVAECGFRQSFVVVALMLRVAAVVCVLLVGVVLVRVDAMPFAAAGVALLTAAAVVLPLVTLVVVSVVLLLAAGLSVWSRRRSRIF